VKIHQAKVISAEVVLPPNGAFPIVPSDWPGPGPIDLKAHDLPHASSSIEWWYLHGHVTLKGGREVSFFSAFFRNRMENEDTHEEHPWRHHLAWAIGEDGGEHRSWTLLDPATPADAVHRIQSGGGSSDHRMRRALLEMAEQGRIPGPDRLLRAPGRVAADRLSLDLDGNCLESPQPGVYTLQLCDPGSHCGCDLRFTALKPPQRHGLDGLVVGFSVKSMFYYFQPRCRVEGTLTLDGVEHSVLDGQGWVDHEFGRHEKGRSADELSFGWTWFAAQLDDGSEITCYETFDRGRRDRVTDRNAIMVFPDGTCETSTDFSLEPNEHWTSVRTFATYPISWRLRLPSCGLDLTIKAVSPRQELLTLLSSPGFWEGRVHVVGTSLGRTVLGKGFVELSGLGYPDSLDKFFTAVGAETRRAVDAFVPEVLDQKDLIRLYASERDLAWINNVDASRAARVLTNPLREIVMRGGKAWRSYALLACIDAVGADPDRYRHWLVLPEILHTGSLIIDDVQDRSTVRRGGPACHVVHGEATAINVGAVSPYLALVASHSEELPVALRVVIYELFHRTMRAAYLGQALDVMGLREMMPAVVETGDALVLEKAVRATHRLKSGVPASGLARVAVRLANGTPAQENALANLFEAYGLAFQIVDDVLNLRGFEGGLKNRAEDLAEGKITAPIAKAFGRLDREGRAVLWDTLETCTHDLSAAEDVVGTLELCGALDDCMKEAYAMIEEAWAAATPLIADSHAKLMLRAFGWYVLERQY
jgi:geranylgeranyl pyrophosphate synthase/predicted secreted hydrolase